MKYKFYRYQFESSSGCGSDNWNYGYIPSTVVSTEEGLESIKEWLESKCMWRDLDGYRGMNFEFIDSLPNEWFEKQIYENSLDMHRLKNELRELKELYNEKNNCDRG